MPRIARINSPGLPHHLMARTFDKLVLFRDNRDREFYVTCLSRRIIETGFICYAWVLMDTHVHLLIRTTEQPLWHLMKPLNSDYARYYNSKYDRRGPLFSDRFKSIATQDQYYLEQLVRYIHLNPIRAGICKTIAQLDRYPWSGHRMIIENNSRFQEVGQVLKRFGNRRSTAIQHYREFILTGIKKPEDSLCAPVRASNEGRKDRNRSECWVIGDAAFQRSVLEKEEHHRLTLAQYVKEGITLDDVCKEVARQMGIEPGLLLYHSKRTPQANARKVVCHFARMLGFPSKETGKYLGIQQAAVTNAARLGVQLACIHKIIWRKSVE